MIDLIDAQKKFTHELTQAGKSLNTIKNYRADLQAFNKFLIEHEHDMLLQTFTTTQVQEYTNYLNLTYGSPNSIRRRVQALRLFFDFLIRQYNFPDNPIKLVPVAPKLLEKPTPVSFKDLNILVRHLFETLSKEQGLGKIITYRNIILVALIYESGIKVSDLAKLELQDVIESKNGMRIMVRPPKRDPYSVPLSLRFKQIWQDYKHLLKQNWPTQSEPNFVLFNANPYKILSGTLSPRGIELFFEEIRSQLKINITARQLRQACVCRWLYFKTPDSQIKQWLGVAPDYDISLYHLYFKEEKETPLYLDLLYA